MHAYSRSCTADNTQRTPPARARTRGARHLRAGTLLLRLSVGGRGAPFFPMR
jgi:hypothetical protein